MSPTPEDFTRLCTEESELHDRKNADYAGERGYLNNLTRCEVLGVPAYHGVLVRLQDKYARQETLALREPKVVDESLVDVHRDISVYSKLGQMLLEEFKDCPDRDKILANLTENAEILRKWRANPNPMRPIIEKYADAMLQRATKVPPGPYTCSTCQFSRDKGDHRHLSCVKNQTDGPTVCADDWCGQYCPKPQEPRP